MPVTKTSESLHLFGSRKQERAIAAQIYIDAQKLMDASSAYVWLTYDASFQAHRTWLKPALMASGVDWQLGRFQTA